MQSINYVPARDSAFIPVESREPLVQPTFVDLATVQDPKLTFIDDARPLFDEPNSNSKDPFVSFIESSNSVGMSCLTDHENNETPQTVEKAQTPKSTENTKSKAKKRKKCEKDEKQQQPQNSTSPRTSPLPTLMNSTSRTPEKLKKIQPDDEALVQEQINQLQNFNRKLHLQEKKSQSPLTTCLKPINYECIVCKQDFKNPSKLLRHLRSHTNEKPFECSFCGMFFTDKSSLRRHKIGVHKLPYMKKNGQPAEMYPCMICNKVFSMPSKLVRHLRVHSGEKPFSCSCGSSFNDRSSMLRHRKRKKCPGAFEETISDQKEKVVGITIPAKVPAAPPETSKEKSSETLVNTTRE